MPNENTGNTAKPKFSYAMVLQDYRKFVQSGGRYSTPFNIFDAPTLNFFRIFFHFKNGDDNPSEAGQYDTGFLAPTWMLFGDSSITDVTANAANWQILWDHNSAWSYLALNQEYERAENLRLFCELLSNINSESPWYFQNIKGLDTALERKQINGDFSFDAERQRLSIECLDESVDNRIGTLLDLYRSIVWSWQTKREVVPSNLRKFDMTIVVYSSPIRCLHTPKTITTADYISSHAHKAKSAMKHKNAILNQIQDGILGASENWTPPNEVAAGFASMGGPTSSYITSYKSFEFHGCEFDYNSSKSGYGDGLSNEAGSTPKYTIDILYDDVYETRYNEFAETTITDLILTDMAMIKYGEEAYNTDDSYAVLGQHDKSGVSYSDRVPHYETTDHNDPANPNYFGKDLRALTGAVTGPLNQFMDKMGALANRITDPLLNGISKFSVQSIFDQALGRITDYAGAKITGLALGNLFGFSLTNVADQVGQALGGNLAQAASLIGGNNYEAGSGVFGRNYKDNRSTPPSKNNIYSDSPQPDTPDPTPHSNIFEDNYDSEEHIIELGNIFGASTAMRNI